MFFTDKITLTDQEREDVILTIEDALGELTYPEESRLRLEALRERLLPVMLKSLD
jgi:hypothetical protein